MNETDSAHNDEAQASDVLSSSATSITEEEYIYTPLEDNHVRLLEILPGNDKDPIQCRFHIVSRDELDALPYGALSYTWGTTKPDKRIFIDGKFVLITSNLEDALFEFRRQPPELPPLLHHLRLKAAREELDRLKEQLYKLTNVNDSEPELATIDDLYKRVSTYIWFGQCNDRGILENLVDEFITVAANLWNRIAIRKGISRFKQTQRYLWVDSICINQKNAKERANQVRLMTKIYLQASLLVVWLGLGTSDNIEKYEVTSRVFDEIVRYTTTWTWTPGEHPSLEGWVDEQSCEASDRRAVTDVLAELIQHPYFTRVWVVQEYILGTFGHDALEGLGRIVTCVGSFRFRNFVSIAAGLLMRWPLLNKEIINATIKDTPFELLLSRMAPAVGLSFSRNQYYEYANQNPPASPALTQLMLLKLVAETAATRQATDPRDHIYSVLGLVENCFFKNGARFVSDSLVIDYEASVEAVYSSFVKEIMFSTRRLDVLVFCYGSNLGWSWSPDWSTISSFQAGTVASSIRNIGYDFLEMLPFNVSPGTVCDARFNDDKMTLTVSGFRLSW